MTREEYKKTYVRMMDSVRSSGKGESNCKGVACDNCPLRMLCTSVSTAMINAFEFIDVVEKWGKEHPVITNADKFEEVFGYAPHDPMCSNSYPCPNSMGADFYDCSSKICADCKKGYWEAEYVAPKIGTVTSETTLLNG